MKLSELLTSYLEINHVTLSQLAERTSISKATLSLMKRGINNKGEPEPSTPDISTLQKLAAGMGIDLDELFKALDRDTQIAWDGVNIQTDSGISIDNVFSVSEHEQTVIKKYRELTDWQRDTIDYLINAYIDNRKNP